ncbi:alpha/beta fold hydrolase [Oleiagrimonas sp.]|jgi:carboxylesterase|uniref:alpha/beta hydrolase n=1 Tax=Oleiagrimonas sp. TaxID=2010330 RepID=UPI0026264E08|nr:alpha/beta fold hydrolase [Oleiagrimonas sp.]MDA3914481.1 alpha/beta fold hydrolase [Oleiagrimonas sp.]
MIENAEFFLEGGRSGVLLVHGLTGTPSEMALVGKGLNKAGFTVHAVQLAGHCGSEEDLLATGWKDWYASVDHAAARLRAKVDHLFVAGLSMGALLALLLAAERPKWIDGVGVLGATFRYDGWSIPPIGRLAFMLPLVKRLGLFRHTSFIERPPYGLRDERIRARISAAMFGDDSSVAGLPGNPWHSLADLFQLAARTRKRLPEITAPCLVAHATEDDVATLRYNAGLVMRRVAGPVELLPLDDSYHMITIDRQRRLLIARMAEFFGQHAGAASVSERERMASAA